MPEILAFRGYQATNHDYLFHQEKHVNLVHIESRKSRRRNSEFEIFVDCDSNREQLDEIFHLLKSHVSVVSVNPTDNFTVQEDGKEEKQCDVLEL